MRRAPSIPRVPGFEHRVASHCESGSLRNLLGHAGVEVSEAMVFGIGSGPAFYYLFFTKGPSTFPLVGIRNPPGSILRNVARLTGVEVRVEQPRTTSKALARAESLLLAGTPVAASVEMFRMRYLPDFMRVHAPFHFVVLLGREGERFAVSDPYHPEVAGLDREDLVEAWATGARMARDNLMCHVGRVPAAIDWRRASLRAIRRTCRAMVLPPGVGSLFWFVGVEGMRTYARRIRDWPARHRGVRLREGILFNAVGFEDQGTGGAAFRLMYAAFLQEVADLARAPALAEIAERFVAHGRRWRGVSRRMVVLGRMVPMQEEAFDDWLRERGAELNAGLAEVSESFREFADVEEALFRALEAEAARLARASRGR